MSLLMRAPQACASWFWDLEDYAPPGLRSALTVAARMSAVLRKHDLLQPTTLEWHWFVPALGGSVGKSSVELLRPLDDDWTVRRVEELRPVAFPEAETSGFHVLGTGEWSDADGARHREERLVELTVSAEPLGLSADVAVFHDVWGPFDFRGSPHPAVHRHNAPRLAAALRELETVLGVPAEPEDASARL
ncbi:hypothetical protein OG481_08800 [Streptomyces longwoodensis]|uniref:hypothetical protein n=1 Tax=Streptomyces longwoodensis TaxID=68231 RepID=UPI002DDADF5C|nr:hypothetical protein [Streptomyces longwoodensis]WRY88623.1 hypothetical protein OG481_08800 [Streptomyces longwoodensis]